MAETEGERHRERRNAEVARQAWDAVAGADVEALRELWAPDIVWHVTGDNPWSGDHVGVDAVLDYLADVGEAGEAYDARLEDVLASRDRALLVFHVSARRAGRTVETQQGLLARITNGRMTEAWTLPLDPRAFRGFYDPPRRKRGNHLTSIQTA